MNALLQTKPASPPDETDSFKRLAELGATVSASRLSLWLQCKLKFYFRYVLRTPRPPTPSMHCGSTVHAVLKHWNRIRGRGDPLALEPLQKLFGLYWDALQKDVEINWQGGQQSERASAWRTLEHYLVQTPIKANERSEAVEVSLAADLSSHGLPRLVGIIDLVRAGGRIVDFKVSSKTPVAQSVLHFHEVQLTCYSLLYRQSAGKNESGLELHHLIKTKAPKLIISSLPPATDQQRLRLFRQIEAYQSGVARQDFVPSPGFHCSACAYFDECRLWC